MERVFDIALTLHADHELNASTFAARVTAATLSDIYSAVTSAIGALEGSAARRRERGRDQDAARSRAPDDAVEQVKATSCEGRRSRFRASAIACITPSIRARPILKQMCEELGKRTGHIGSVREVDHVSNKRSRTEEPECERDFYSASTYYSLGIPIDLFTPIFAVSRMSGWTAHILEQYRNNRLIRPRADYTGQPDGQPWVPIEER